MMNRHSVYALIATLLLSGAARAAEPPAATRHVQIRYTATIPAAPSGTKQMRIWMPYPESDAWQTVSNVAVEAPYTHSMRHEAEYGNAILFLEGAPASDPITVTLSFEATRKEFVNRPDHPSAAAGDHVDPGTLARFRKRDTLVPLDGKIAAVAREATQGRTTQQDKSRGIYDYVTSHLKYDKTGTGWGRGDAIWACDAKRGNCTDYHSLLIGMARAEGIPAKFEIGLPVPEDKSDGT